MTFTACRKFIKDFYSMPYNGMLLSLIMQRVQLTLSMPEDLKEKLVARARLEDLTLSQLIRRLAREAVEESLSPTEEVPA